MRIPRDHQRGWGDSCWVSGPVSGLQRRNISPNNAQTWHSELQRHLFGRQRDNAKAFGLHVGVSDVILVQTFAYSGADTATFWKVQELRNLLFSHTISYDTTKGKVQQSVPKGSPWPLITAGSELDQARRQRPSKQSVVWLDLQCYAMDRPFPSAYLWQALERNQQ